MTVELVQKVLNKIYHPLLTQMEEKMITKQFQDTMKYFCDDDDDNNNCQL